MSSKTYLSIIENIEKEYENKKYKKNLPKSLKSLLDKEFPEPEFIIDGLLPEGLTLLVGLPKTGKSYLALHVGLAVASGGVALGYFDCKQRNVLYLALEDNERRLQMRAKELLKDEEVPDNFYYETSWPKLPDGLELLREVIKEKGINFVIIDTLARIVSTNGRRGSNVYLEEYNMVEPLSDLCLKENISILVIHHRRKTKSEEDWTLDFSGSTGITAVADNLIHLKRTRGEMKAELRITGRDLPNDIEMALEWDNEIGFYKYIGNLDAIVESEQKRQILDYLKEAEEAKPSEIAKETGLKINVVYTVLNRLKDDGKVIRTKRGVYKLYP
jgi:RecA-family ATPase/DNA-binding transcriptional ArsR family regulator